MGRHRFRRASSALALAAALGLAGCGPTVPRLAPAAANPNTPPMRAFTSFSGALRCMDRLLTQAKRRSILISSTDLPDRTNGVRVGGDDMLINAINTLNRTSRAYIFVDQPLERDAGQIDLLTTNGKKEVRPQVYIRGSISQLDSDPLQGSLNAQTDDLSQSNGLDTSTNWSRGTDVVSVDMHLVAWPSRRILPGGSVANSMVVTNRGFSSTRTGLIELTQLDLTLQFRRVESRSQAVRALIELGVIELLGRHSGVPYWTCLAQPDTEAWREDHKETAHVLTPKPVRMNDVQQALIDLDYLDGRVTGRRDRATARAIARFQTEEGLIATGRIDFDLWRRLQERMAREATAPVPAAPAPVQTAVQTAASGALPGRSGPRTPARPPVTTIIQRPKSEPRGRAAPPRGQPAAPAPEPAASPSPTPEPPATPAPSGDIRLVLRPETTQQPVRTPAPLTTAEANGAPGCANPRPDLALPPGCPLTIDLSQRLRR